VLPSTTTLTNICQREYALTVDAIRNQLPLQNNRTLDLEAWTSTNNQAKTSVITYFMNHNYALSKVQLAFDEMDRLFFSHFETQFWMIGHRPTCWSKDSRTLEGHA